MNLDDIFLYFRQIVALIHVCIFLVNHQFPHSLGALFFSLQLVLQLKIDNVNNITHRKIKQGKSVKIFVMSETVYVATVTRMRIK